MKVIFVALLLIGISTAQIVESEINTKNYNTLENNGSVIKMPTRVVDGNCICMPYSDCLVSGRVNEFGMQIFDPKVGESDVKSKIQYCPKATDVCCILNTNDDLPVVHTKEDSSSLKVGCGYRNFDGISGKITRDDSNTLTNEGEYPWMVYVYRKELANGSPISAFKCAGTLINEKVVLTSAYCLYKIQYLHVPDLRVRVGDWNIRSNEEKFPHRNFNVEWIFTHPKFELSYRGYDFALIILRNAVTLAENIQNVCLPEFNEVIDSEQCYVTGWGTTSFANFNKFSTILKAIQLPMVDSKECEARFQKMSPGKQLSLHPSLICAGGGPGFDACNSDHGSPLVCPLKNDATRYVQAGIVAWNLGCNNENPSTFANVAFARPWIDKILQMYNISSTSYTPL